MKTEFRAIAMRFNEQNWRGIVGKIESAGIRHNVWGIDEHDSYLVNNWGGKHGPFIGNCNEQHSVIQMVDKVYEEWDEAVFLEACGIDAEFETFIITKEQILQLNSYNKYNVGIALKEWFPKAFESEMEAGRWYKLPTFGKLMFMFTGGFGNDATYGFNFIGEFSEGVGVHKTDIHNFVLATDEEVETALIEEAKRRYKIGIKVDCIHTTSYNKINTNNFEFDGFSVRHIDKHGFVCCVYEKGKWAEIINEPLTLTIDDIAEKFGVSVEQIKIKK